MPFADSLHARGLISDDAMAGLSQRVADLKQPRPYESGGAGGANSVYVPKGYGETITSGYGAQGGGIWDKPENLVMLKRLLSQGMTQRQAADKLGTSLGSVQRKIRAEGLPTDPARGAPIKNIGEFTPPPAPESSIDKLVKSLFKPQPSSQPSSVENIPAADPYLERLRQGRSESE
jgi:hypothetical protein